MPIKGLTDRGLSFPEIGQIRKGAPKGERRPGKDLTYFRVEFDEKETKAQEKFVAVYGAQPTAIRVILPFNEIDRMWDAWLEAYTAGRMIARSDGENVIYRVDTKTGELVVRNGLNVATNQPEPHPANDIAGADYQGKPVKFRPSGRLKIIVPELERAAYLTVLTTSLHDIANISDQLRAFSELNNGQIAGIPFILRRRPKKISVPKDNQRVRMVKWLLSIEADPDWVRAKLTQVKRLALPENGLGSLALPSGEELDHDEEILSGEWEEYDDEDPEEQPEQYPREDAAADGHIELTIDGAAKMVTPKGKPLGELTAKQLEIVANDKAHYDDTVRAAAMILLAAIQAEVEEVV